MQSSRHGRTSRRNGILLVVDYYAAFDALAGVYLEDSWVLEVAPSHTGLAFRIEAVLTPDHPLYEPPVRGEQYCYRTAWMDVRSPEPVELELSGAAPARDASGTTDLGNIDSFAPDSDGWSLEGSWGNARIRDPSVSLRFT